MLSRFDHIIKKELENWPEMFSIMYKVQPNGPKITIIKKNGVFNQIKLEEEKIDLVIYIKNITIAYLLMTSRINTIQVFMEHRAALKGNVRIATSLIRILNRKMLYFYPKFIVKRLVKRLPSIPWYRRYYGRIRIYFIGIPLGIKHHKKN